MKTLLTDTQTAELLGVAPATLRKWRWSGTGPPFVKLGGAVRYDPNELARYIESCSRRSTSDPGTTDPAAK